MDSHQNVSRTYKPTLAGPYRVLFMAEKYGDAINDHTVFRDAKGSWRAVGILSKGLRFLNTPSFAHGVGSSLSAPMTELPPLFEDDPDSDKKWAPHVIVERGVYHLFAGPGKVRHYTSPDGIDWAFGSIAIRSEWDNFRDTMILKIAPDSWLMYATDRDNCVSAFESKDLDHWTRVGVAFRAVWPATVYPRHPGFLNISSCESPFVIHYGDFYYLSICLTNCLNRNYCNTVVVRSHDPCNFGVYAAGGRRQTCDYVTTLAAHAAEYVQDERGNWYITSAGWRQRRTPPGAAKGALCIAPLAWEECSVPPGG